MAKLRLVPASGDPVEVTKDPMLVGRDPGGDLVISDGSVSRKHARIEKRGDAWCVVDQGSANGTFVDSQRVADAALGNGQELRFGAIAYTVEIEAPEELGATIAGLPGATVIQPVPLVPPVARPAAPAAPPPLPAAAPPRPAAPPPPPPMGAPPPPPRAAALPPPPPPGAVPRFGAPGSPVKPMGGGAPGAKKGKSPAFWIATGCCGCLLLVLVVVGVIFGVATFATEGPVNAVRTALAEAKAGQLDAAYGRLSGQMQSQLPREAFEAFVGAHPAVKDNADSTFMSREVKNDRALLERVVLVATSGEREVITFRLVKEGGDWKIDGMDVVEGAAQSAGGSEGGGGPPARRSAAPPRGDAPAGDLAVEPPRVTKTAGAGSTTILIRIRVTGFAVRPEGDAYRIDLSEDIETYAPDGSRIDSLSREGFHRLDDRTSASSGNSAEFKTTFTMNPTSPEGIYRVRITVNDLVSGTAQSAETTFDLP